MSETNGNGFRPKLQLDVNVPIVATLLYDEPKLVPSKYGGDQYLYAVETNGQEYSLFLDPEVSQMIQRLQVGKGGAIRIARMTVRDGNRRGKPEWKVSPLGGNLTPQLQASIDQVHARRGAQTDRHQEHYDSSKPPPPSDADIPPDIAAGAQRPEPVPPPREQNGTARAVDQASDRPQSTRPTTILEDAIKTVIAACHSGAEYAKQIGFQMPPFSSDDISRMAMTLAINKRGDRS
jgi:hypothetical protein